MSQHKRFHLRDLDMLAAESADLGVTLPIDEDLGILAEPLTIGRHVVANRLAVQPMEGFDSTPDGSPDELALRRYQRYAAGGSGLIWFEATAILHEARSNAQQLCLHAGNVAAFARLVDGTRQAAREAYGRDVTLILQLTHSGRYSKPDGVARPLIAHHSPVLDPLHKLPADYPLVTDEYLDRLQDTYVEAARLAAQAGFDGVDIKGCHRYLISELLASHTRKGRYGGSLENRARLLREVIGRVAAEVPQVFATTRINVYDAIAYPYGFGVSRASHETPDLTEPLAVIDQLRQLGIPLVNVTIGNPYYNPHYGRPYDWPLVGMPTPNEHPLEGVARFIDIVRQVQQAFPDLPVMGAGYTWLRHLFPYVAAGALRSKAVTIVGQGRGAFAYPDSPRDIFATGRMNPQHTCVACSGCTQIMRDGARTGCVVRDSAIYGPSYRLARRFALDHLRSRAHECRDCEFATCTVSCPAGVDVPGFIRAFADGDIAKSYTVLKQANVLPEMCAYICPCEVQCEGGCVEQAFRDSPLPIRDIQLVVSKLARRDGLVGVKLPATQSARHVAVVGGGPAGLACTIKLLEAGHQVTIFEKSERLGGTPESAIPEERYTSAAAEVEAILAPARAAGRVNVRYRQALGSHFTLGELLDQFDAVFLALGLPGGLSLGSAQGVLDALTFLEQVKRGQFDALPKKVAVLGGGNTAIDAALTAKARGAQDVYLIYRRSVAEMPAWPAERNRFLRSGGNLLALTQPLDYVTDAEGKLTALRIVRTELGEIDASGRRAPVPVPDSESTIHVDLVIEALGQRIPADVREALQPLKLDRHGLVAVGPKSTATSMPGVFAGGDLTNGGTTAVQGIADGMRAAAEINRFLASASVVS